MKYRFAIFSDTHGHAPPDVRATVATAILNAGDVYDAAADPEGIDTDALQIWLERLAVPAFAVRGNHDHDDPLGFFRRCEDVSGRLRQLMPNLFVAGIGFAPKHYFDLPGETDLVPQCRDVLRQVRRLDTARDNVILLTHYPARHGEVSKETIEQPGWMFECIRELIEELRPIAVVQGHMHEWFGRTDFVHIAGRHIPLITPGPRGGILEIDMAGRSATFAPLTP